MRVLYDHQVFSLQTTGGISRYYIELAKHLSQERCWVPEILLGIDGQVSDDPGMRGVSIRRCPIVTLPPGPIKYLVNEVLSNGYAAVRGKVDVYHPTLYRRMPLVPHRKMVVTHHDCIHERYPNLFSNSDQIRRWRTKLFQIADAIICVSESTRRDLHHFYDVHDRKTCAIHLGVTQLTASHGTPPQIGTDRPYLLYVGSRASYKNFIGLLRAFRRAGLAQEFRIVVAGGGPLTKEEDREAGQLGPGVVIHFEAPSNAELASLYTYSHAFVYPSLYEGFGLPPLEAMQFKIPVLVARGSATTEICRDGAVFFDPENEDSFVAGLQSICFDPDVRREASTQGFAVQSQYSWSRCARETIRVYEG